MIKLSICIPTVDGREASFLSLYRNINAQLIKSPYNKEAEVIFEKDNKQISIGSKRDILYKRAKGLYAVQIDDDDNVPDYYIETLMSEINKSQPDCFGYIERCVINGAVQYSKISNEFTEWETRHENGYHYRRTPFFKTPIKTELCLQTGVKDIRFGEDHDFAIRIKNLLKSEVFIDKVMYLYTANSLTPQQHKERYGL